MIWFLYIIVLILQINDHFIEFILLLLRIDFILLIIPLVLLRILPSLRLHILRLSHDLPLQLGQLLLLPLQQALIHLSGHHQIGQLEHPEDSKDMLIEVVPHELLLLVVVVLHFVEVWELVPVVLIVLVFAHVDIDLVLERLVESLSQGVCKEEEFLFVHIVDWFCRFSKDVVRVLVGDPVLLREDLGRES